MKVYEQLQRGQIMQPKSHGGALCIILSKTNDGLYRCFQMGHGWQNIDAEDIVAVGPFLGEIKLHEAKVNS